jgi:HSP20 family protein
MRAFRADVNREVNRLLEDALRSFDSRLPAFGRASLGGGWPRIEISDNDKEAKVTAEVSRLRQKASCRQR